jgi:hypothetical protein
MGQNEFQISELQYQDVSTYLHAWYKGKKIFPHRTRWLTSDIWYRENIYWFFPNLYDQVSPCCLLPISDTGKVHYADIEEYFFLLTTDISFCTNNIWFQCINFWYSKCYYTARRCNLIMQRNNSCDSCKKRNLAKKKSNLFCHTAKKIDPTKLA